MAPIVVSSFFFAAAPRLLLRMGTPQPIAQHEHARVRFVSRHEVPFLFVIVGLFLNIKKRKEKPIPNETPRKQRLCVF